MIQINVNPGVHAPLLSAITRNCFHANCIRASSTASMTKVKEEHHAEPQVHTWVMWPKRRELPNGCCLSKQKMFSRHSTFAKLYYSQYRLKREKSRFWVKNYISVKVMASKWFLLLFSNVTWWMNLADDKKSKNYIISWEEIATIPIIANIGLNVKNHDFELRMILASKLWHQSGFFCCFLM